MAVAPGPRAESRRTRRDLGVHRRTVEEKPEAVAPGLGGESQSTNDGTPLGRATSVARVENGQPAARRSGPAVGAQGRQCVRS